MPIRNEIIDQDFEELDKVLIDLCIRDQLTFEEADLVATRVHAHVVERWISDMVGRNMENFLPKKDESKPKGDLYR